MGKYNIIFGRKIDRMVQQHAAFLSRVSIPAAKQFRKDFGEILGRIEENPFQFPVWTDEAIGRQNIGRPRLQSGIRLFSL